MQAHPSLCKKLNQNHFKMRHMSHTENTQSKVQFDNDNEKFDTLGAGNLLSSKPTQSKLNALFMDTRVFNMSSAQYIPDLSLPGALDRLNSNDGSSPLNRDRREKNASYANLRDKQKVSSDVAQMLQMKPSHSRELTQLINSYNPDEKVCVPSYNIKSYYNKEMVPFFSPERKKSQPRVSSQIQPSGSGSFNFGGKSNSITNLNQNPSDEKLMRQSEEGRGSQNRLDVGNESKLAGFAMKADAQHFASNATISSVHVDPALLEVRHE